MDFVGITGDPVKNDAVGRFVFGHRKQATTLTLWHTPRFHKQKPAGRVPTTQVINELPSTTPLGGNRGTRAGGTAGQPGTIEEGRLDVSRRMENRQELERIEIRVGFHERTSRVHNLVQIQGGAGFKDFPN